MQGVRLCPLAGIRGAKKIVISTKMLNDFGWIEGVPDDLAGKSMRRERNAESWKAINWMRTSRTLLPPWMSQWPRNMANSYKSAFLPTFDWVTLVMFSRLRDKEFDSFEAISGATGDMLMYTGDATYNKWRDDLLGSGYHYTDTIICLDANTGKELWTKEFPGSIPPPDMMMYIGASSTPAVWTASAMSWEAQGSIA
jgi:hypothetical protein